MKHLKKMHSVFGLFTLCEEQSIVFRLRFWTLDFLLGCQTQSESAFHFSVSSVSGKVFLVTPLLSGVFVHRVFCAYFDGFQGVGKMRRFLWWTL